MTEPLTRICLYPFLVSKRLMLSNRSLLCTAAALFVLVGAAGSVRAQRIAPPSDSLSQGPVRSTFRTPREMQPSRRIRYAPRIARILAMHGERKAVPRPLPARTPHSWKYAAGDPSNGLMVSASAMPTATTQVTLRHRVLEPNTPLWYRRQLTVNEPLLMQVRADDGAQVFVDGKRLEQHFPEHFVIQPAPEARTVRIRVLNNAMKGGLNGVRLYPLHEYEAYRHQLAARQALDTLVTKLRRWRRPPARVVDAVGRAVTEHTDAAVAAARHVLARWPLITVGPYLQAPGLHSMTILWETDVPAGEAFLVWGRAPGALSHRTPVGAIQGIYEVTLDSLAPDTKYFYRIHVGASISPVYSFVTNAASGPFEFSVWADSQSGWPTFAQSVHAMQRYPLAFSVAVGDFVVPGSSQLEWHRFFEILRPLGARVPVHLIPGNHDYDGYYDDLRPRLFERYVRNGSSLDETYSAWTYGNARFVAIDPNEQFPIGLPEGSKQRKWFIDQLSTTAWNEADWRFVLVHQPPYAQAWQGYHGDDVIRDLVAPRAASAGIDFVISGHTHAYERRTRTVDGHTTHYLIVGGAGGALERRPYSKRPRMEKVVSRHHFGRFIIDGKRLRFEAITTDLGRTIDRIALDHTGQ